MHPLRRKRRGGRESRETSMSSNIMMPLVIAVLMYTLFGTFNAQAGGRIDAALS